MEERGVKLSVLLDVADELKTFNEGQRVLLNGRSGVQLRKGTVQIRTLLENNVIQREYVDVDDCEDELESVDAAVGDRAYSGGDSIVEQHEHSMELATFNTGVFCFWCETTELLEAFRCSDGCEFYYCVDCYEDSIKTKAVHAVTGVTKNSYTLTPLKSSKFVHEANFAHWDWDLSRTFSVSATDFKRDYTRDTFMTTKDAMEEITKHRSQPTQQAYIDVIPKKGVGQATKFVSHAWKYGFADVVRSLADRVDPVLDFLWFDICTVNQHVWIDVDFQSTFKDAVGKIGHTLLVLAPWRNPIPLTRSWCLWEIHSTVSHTNAVLEVVLSKDEEVSFMETLRDDFDAIMESLCVLDTRNAAAGNPNDQAAVYDAVNASGGFEIVNENCLVGIRNGLSEIGCRNVNENDWHLMNNLGCFLKGLGRMVEAENYFKLALAGFEELHGPNHVETLSCVANLALLYQKLGNMGEAKLLFRRDATGSEETFGPQHPMTLLSKNNLAGFLYTQGDVNDAKSLFEEVLTVRREILGPAHGDTLTSMNNLGSLLQDIGEWEESESLYRSALEGRTELYGHRHPDTLRCAHNLATLLQARGNLVEAEELFRRTLRSNEETLGKDHEDTLDSVDGLASLLEEVGKVEEAKTLYQRRNA